MRKIAMATFASLLFWSTASAAQESEVMQRLQNADAEAGKNAALICAACHTLEADGGTRVGPNLYGLINRTTASVSDFQYSEAMASYGGDWSPERLDTFLKNPMEAVPGTTMVFPGVQDDTERANLIAYLNTLSDSPLATIGSDSVAESEEPTAMGKLVAGKGVEVTYYSCTSCHSEMIVAQQGKTREGWDKLLVWMVDEQGMSELPPENRELILDYLAEHYNTDRPNFPR